MDHKPLEVADIINNYLPQMDLPKLPIHHLKVLQAISSCRTAELGGHIDECGDCGHLKISYNSCRNRHCPKCQGVNKEMWIIQQEDMLLPVAYYHVVFTLPHELNLLCMYNPRELYDLLFESAWHTIRTLSMDPKWIGARPAATMVLHTWSQTLMLHPHLHCIVPNGGLTASGQWQFPKKGTNNFLYPVNAMKKIYRGYFMAKLKEKIALQTITIPQGYFETYSGYNKWKDLLYSKDWVVYTKKPFSQAKHVIDYLGRYSHRVAITNSRILAISDSNVSIQYKDYKAGAQKKKMVLGGVEFIRRFCLHILPPRYRKIRQFGFLSNASKAKSIAQARKSLGIKHIQLLTKAQRKQIAIERLFGNISKDQCPCCKKGIMKMKIAITRNKPPPKHIIDKIKRQSKLKHKSKI